MKTVAQKEVTTMQWFYLELIRGSSFNSFNGETVYKDLMENGDLWKGVIMTDDMQGAITLRDLPDDYNNVCSLYITADKDPEDLKRMAEQWEADEVDWVHPTSFDPLPGIHTKEGQVLRVWWD